MSSPQTALPDSGFQNRLNRVAERRAPIEADKKPVDVLPDWRENAFGPAGIAAALATGLAAVFLVRVARFHIQGVALVGDAPGVTFAIEFAAALMLSFMVFLFLPWKGVKYRFLQFGGVAVMALTMHNMVHSAPGIFGLAFSQEWTERVMAETEPGSMYVRGHSIPFAGKIKEAPAEEAVAATGVSRSETAPAAAEQLIPEDPAAKPALPRRIVIGQ